MKELTQEYLKSILNYNADTGIFTRIKRSAINRNDAGNELSRKGDKDGYLRVVINRKTYKQHRLAWFYFYGKWPKECIDHINHDVTDNRIVNLREASTLENAHNQIRCHPTNKSCNVLGVTFRDRSNVYEARIMTAGKYIHLGSHKTLEQARAAYLKAKRELHPTCTI